MFRPVSAIFAARKAAKLRQLMAAAGHPLPAAACLWTIALAYGWISWEELCDELARPGVPSPYDEDLAGPSAGAGVLAQIHELTLARRRRSAADAFVTVTGLPEAMAPSMMAVVRPTGDPARRTVPSRPSPADGPLRSGILAAQWKAFEGVWLSPEAFREMRRLSELPRHPEFVAFAASITGKRAPSSTVPSLPAHRPR